MKKYLAIISLIAGFNQSTLAKKIKHASDFGVNTTKKNPKTFKKFGAAINNHLKDGGTIQKCILILRPIMQLY